MSPTQRGTPPPRNEATFLSRFATRLRTRRAATSLVAVAAIGLSGSAAAGAFSYGPGSKHRNQPPIAVTVFSPGAGDTSGAHGVGFIVDVALDARKDKYNSLLSAAAGYKPFFNDPMAPTFHPGSDPGAPGLVVLLSTTPNKAGTPFRGPRTNLAGLFQINGVARVHGKAETWNTWQPGKPVFGTGPTTLTVYVVAGTAPAVIPPGAIKKISNVVHVPFHIAG